MKVMLIRKAFFALFFLLFIGSAGVLALKPRLIDGIIASVYDFRTQDISALPVIHPSSRDMEEVISVKNAHIVPEEDTNLAFLFSGTLSEVLVAEGDITTEGEILASLDTTELKLEEKQAIQKLAGAQASLIKLKNGTRKEDIAISLDREKLASSMATSGYSLLYEVLTEAYKKVDDAFANKLEEVILTNRGEDSKFVIPLNDSKIEESLKEKRIVMSILLASWKNDNQTLSRDESIVHSAKLVRKNLAMFSDYFDEISQAINRVNGNGSSVVSARAVMAGIRNNMTAAERAITDAESRVTNAENSLKVAASERALKQAPTESEDIRIAQAEVEALRHQIAIVRDNMEHAVLRAPHGGMIVKKVFRKRKEIVEAGEHVVLLVLPVVKLRADVPEEEIASVSIGALATTSLRAYRGRILCGKVVSIEPNEIIKNESTYFRTDIFFDAVPDDMLLRSGMTGKVVISTGRLRKALFLPRSVLVYKDGRYAVSVREGGVIFSVPVALGESEGDEVEVIGDINIKTDIVSSGVTSCNAFGCQN